jgi:hypothetical protein
MSTTPVKTTMASDLSFSFESYGVHVRIESDQRDILDEAKKVARKALLNKIRPVNNQGVDQLFRLTFGEDGMYVMVQNGEQVGFDPTRRVFFKFFNSMLRVAVAERARDRVFMHAGVVGWKGKAIILPANSFQGKSTLVAELVRNGAVYYTDDYAIFDEQGLVHPFARPLSLRKSDPGLPPDEVTAEELGGTRGDAPIPVGMVMLTGYRPKAKWRPRILSAGQGLLEMIPYTIAIRFNPDFSMRVLNIIARRAIIASSHRGSAEEFAKTLLNFVDKNVN